MMEVIHYSVILVVRINLFLRLDNFNWLHLDFQFTYLYFMPFIFHIFLLIHLFLIMVGFPQDFLTLLDYFLNFVILHLQQNLNFKNLLFIHDLLNG